MLLWLLSGTFSALTTLICLVLVRYRAGRRWLIFFATSSAFFAATALIAAHVPSVDAVAISLQGTMPLLLAVTAGFIVFAIYAVLCLDHPDLSYRQAVCVMVGASAALIAIDAAIGSKPAFACILVGNILAGAFIASRLMRRRSIFYRLAGTVFLVRSANGVLTLVAGLIGPDPAIVEIIRHVSVGANLATALSVLLIEFDDTRHSLIETRDALAASLAGSEAISRSRAEVNRQLESILDGALVGIFAVRDGRVVSANRRADELLGAGPGELIGQSIEPRFVAPDALRAFEVDAAGRREHVGEFEVKRPGGDGSRWVLLSGRVDGGSGTESVRMMVDISDRRQAELALRQNERKFQALFRDAPIAMAIRSTRDRRIVQVNPAWETLTGWSAMEAFGRTSDELGLYVRPSDRDRVAAARSKTGLDDVQIEIRTKGGQVKVVQLRGNPLAGYDPDLYIVMTIDITEQVRLEAQLRQSQKLEAIGQLTGGIAHDFNNLLAVILGNLEALHKSLAGTDRSRLDKAILAAERGTSLTRNLLAFARRQPLSLSDVSIQTVLGDMLPLLRTFVDERITLKLEVDGMPPPALVDGGMLQNAIINLVVNARDALTHGGTVALAVAGRVLAAKTVFGKHSVPAGSYVELTVRDDGTGIDEKVIDRIFEPFFTTKDTGSGTGLGLSMVHGFVVQSGGHLWVESALGVGTTFHLLFPATAGNEGALPVAAGPAVPPEGAGRSALVVDDNAGIAALVSEVLDGFGFSTEVARAASEALRLLHDDRRFDVLVTDVVLPGDMNGCQLVAAALARNPDLACIMMSGYPRDALDETELPASVPLLQKPFRAAELAQALRRVLGPPPGATA